MWAGNYAGFFFAKNQLPESKPYKMENGSLGYHILSVPKFKEDQNLNLSTVNKRTSQLSILQNEQLKLVMQNKVMFMQTAIEKNMIRTVDIIPNYL